MKANKWDKEHEKINLNFNEPEITNQILFDFPNLRPNKINNTSSPSDTDESGIADDYCEIELDYDNNWAFPSKKEIWHLKDEYSQLLSAKNNVASIIKNRSGAERKIIRIAHFDTGYDSNHVTFPSEIVNMNLQRNFTGKGDENNANDTGDGKNGGHGTGTLSILAGKSFSPLSSNDSIGLNENHDIEIVPVRIAQSVVLFLSKAFEKALRYIIDLYDDESTRCHIITMSMGGAPTKKWADLVNEAYNKGIFIVSAAGNNFGAATPRTLVYPARFNRVVAACGVTNDNSPYFNDNYFLHFKIMQGNYGPRKYMKTAIAAFTPNMPWAKFGCKDKVSIAGAGTSSATPQIAAAAALYYQKFHEIIDKKKGWEKVQAIRNALFNSAKKVITGKDDSDIDLYFGNGIIQANEMLKIHPDDFPLLMEVEDNVFLPIIRLLGEIFTSESLLEEDGIVENMYDLEILQLIQISPTLQKLLDYEEREIKDLNKEEKRAFLNFILEMPEASTALKSYINKYL